MRRTAIVTVVAASLFVSGRVAAQCARHPDTPPAAGGKTLVGMVADTSMFPVDSADVIIVSVKKETTTHKGVFRFNGLKAGSYEVTARRIGYLPQVRTIVVGDSGGVGEFCLVPYVRGLAPIISSAKAGGLAGVVGDTNYAALKNVEISAVGSDHHATNDSTGAFFLDLKPGKYVVRFAREGYATRLVSVTIPADSGRKVTVWMTPSTTTSMFENENLHELGLRIDTANAVRSRFYTREDLNKTGATDVLQVAKMGLVSKVNDDCDVIIDGGPQTMPIWQLKTADVEMIEVYVDKPARTAPTSLSQGSTKIRVTAPRPSMAPNGCGTVHVYAWLRK